MLKPHRFTVYRHKLVLEDGRLVEKLFIVLVDTDGLYHFTNYHRYIKNPRNRVVGIEQNGDTRIIFVVKLLNYSFITEGIRKLDDLTVETVQNFLNSYGMCQLPDDTEKTHRTKETVERCVRYVLDFLELMMQDRKDLCTIKIDDLYKEVNKRNKHGKAIKVKVPVFDVVYKGGNRPAIFRDIPNSAFKLLFDHIMFHHTELLGLLIAGAFGGLRPSEACNLVRADSPLRAGIKFDVVEGEILKITLDLSSELNLRRDCKSVGGIKKERMQQIPDIFLDAFYKAYQYYMKYLECQKFDPDYAPFTVDKRGNAMTYATYHRKFKDVVRNEIVPIFLSSDDPEIVIYGRTLMEHSLTPHVLRHWFTVQLVLSGISDPGTLMYWRGDDSPDSALTYLQNKSELERMFSRISNDSFEYLKWAAEAKHGT